MCAPMQTESTTLLENHQLAEPIYDINRTYADNVKEGPFFKGDIPKRHWPDEKRWIDFMGYKVASPLGVPSGPLLTSCWTSLAAQLGFQSSSLIKLKNRIIR